MAARPSSLGLCSAAGLHCLRRRLKDPMRFRLPFVCLLAGSAFSAQSGCGGEPDPGAIEIEIGTGAFDFESIERDQELEVVAGLQGGFHFIVNARARGLITGDPMQPGQLGNPLTRFSIYSEDEERLDILGPPYRLGYREASEDWYSLPSGRILQFNQELVESEGLIPAVYGQRLTLRVDIRDARGEEATDEIAIIAVEGPAQEPSPSADAGLDDS